MGTPIAPLLVPLADVAYLLGQVSRRHVERLISSGELPSVKIGHRRLVKLSDLHAFIDKQSTDGASLARGAGGGDEKRQCRDDANRTETEYTKGRTRRSGGRACQTGKAAQLAAVLGYPLHKTRRG